MYTEVSPLSSPFFRIPQIFSTNNATHSKLNGLPSIFLTKAFKWFDYFILHSSN